MEEVKFFAFIENNKINGKGQCKCLNEDIINAEITEEIYNNIDRYIWNGSNVVLDPDYDEKQTAKRKADFESQFIETSMIDSKGNNGYYRQVPHGYANAPQAIEIADKYVRDFEGMTEQIAQMLIFYQKPDFTKPEECTEEWLVEHQFNPPSDMTLQQWKSFEFDFQQRWALLKYKQQQTQQ